MARALAPVVDTDTDPQSSLGWSAVPWRGAVTVTSFSVFPFAAFLVANRHEGLSVLSVAPYAAGVAGTGLLVVAAVWVVRTASVADRVAVALGGAIFLVFNYLELVGPLDTLGWRVRYQLAAWGVLLVVVVVALWLGSRRRTVRQWVLGAGAILVAIPLFQLGWAGVGAVEDAPAVPATARAAFQHTPDIYYIVPDAYARADQLEAFFGFDNTPFLDALTERGFVVADDAYSPYSTTFLTVPSVLQMDYVIEPGPEALAAASGEEQLSRGAFYDIIRGDSEVHRTLRDAGYRSVQAPSTWRGVRCSGAEDLCVEPIGETDAGMVLGELEWALLQMTPVATFLQAAVGETFDDLTSDPVHTVREIQEQAFEEPVFTLLHMMHTHPPFQFNAECGNIASAGRDLDSWRAGDRAGYVETVACANRRLTEMIDLLPRDAIVIIQADHATAFLRSTAGKPHEWQPEHIFERLAVLSAVRLPERCRDHVDDRFAGVNTFRVVFACLRGEEPDLLPDRHMIAVYTRSVTEVVEVEPRAPR